MLSSSRLIVFILLYATVDRPLCNDTSVQLFVSSGVSEFDTCTIGLEDREHSDSRAKFILAFSCADCELNSFCVVDVSLGALGVLILVCDGDDDDDEEEEVHRVIISSDLTTLSCSRASFPLRGLFKLLPSFGSSELILDSNAIASSRFSLPRAPLPNSLNGIPISRVVHTSQEGLQDEPRGSCETLLFLASSIECQRCDAEIEVPGAIVFKLLAGTIRCGNRGEPRIFSRDDV